MAAATAAAPVQPRPVVVEEGEAAIAAVAAEVPPKAVAVAVPRGNAEPGLGEGQ